MEDQDHHVLHWITHMDKKKEVQSSQDISTLANIISYIAVQYTELLLSGEKLCEKDNIYEGIQRTS